VQKEADQMRSLSRWLWVVQWHLALVFLFAGASKLHMPVEALQKLPMPVPFMRFIGVCEVAGALGLILPGLLKIRQWLTPLAACGLVTIMVGAVWVSVASKGPVGGVVPFIVGLMSAFVAYGRTRRGPVPAQQPIGGSEGSAREREATT
jgi:uncharacterized membrane protein YphA (DoxX/SURF4 family)